MRISHLLGKHPIIAIDVRHSVLDAARLMVEHNIGAVPVLDAGRLTGIFTERDLMKRVVVAEKDLSRTAVGEVMTHDPLSVQPEDSLDLCMTIMRRHSFRHLLVCEGHELRGVVSLRDILLHDLDEKGDEVRMMRAYLHSVPGE